MTLMIPSYLRHACQCCALRMTLSGKWKYLRLLLSSSCLNPAFTAAAACKLELKLILGLGVLPLNSLAPISWDAMLMALVEMTLSALGVNAVTVDDFVDVAVGMYLGVRILALRTIGDMLNYM